MQQTGTDILIRARMIAVEFVVYLKMLGIGTWPILCVCTLFASHHQTDRTKLAPPNAEDWLTYMCV